MSANDTNLGDYIVTSVVGITQFLKTVDSLADPVYILKHGLSDNEAVGNRWRELRYKRIQIFDHETLILNEAVGTGDSAFKVKLPDGTTNATSILLGSHLVHTFRSVVR